MIRAAAVLAGLGVLTTAAQAETVRTRYGISLIGLPFGTATVSGTLEPQAYKIELQMKLTGLASILSGSKGAATATGALPGNHVSPTTYATTSSSGDITRTVRMSMVNNNVDQSEITPPWDPFPDRVPVTEADRRAIVDPMSALIMTVPGTGPVIGPAACERTIPVFDGAARFDVVLAFVGTRKVKTKGYAGDVAVCSVRYHPVAGHRANRPGTKFMADNKDMEAWLAPIGQSRIVVPYRISVATMIGTVVVEANQFEVSAGPQATVQAH
ncbi:DUF3108 domain-containing protein [Lichenihabitans sp. Uapishka_5]|uniref:DUF3108 domain-containing protein n=1 Tax=Lichenihabitans sp. Uapishka_5 TaxID=3037302 RepID=UPI0029E7E8B4|nr:DUF3108 domain-containing protein [Lichenihabitans sp. Uapishka_5]